GWALATVAGIGALVWLGSAYLTLMVQRGHISLAHAWPLELWETFGDVGRICLGAGIGGGAALLIRDRNILLPAGVFAAFADCFMVRFGTVHHALQSARGMKVISAMSAHVPAVHKSLPAVTIGMAD